MSSAAYTARSSAPTHQRLHRPAGQLNHDFAARPVERLSVSAIFRRSLKSGKAEMIGQKVALKLTMGARSKAALARSNRLADTTCSQD